LSCDDSDPCTVDDHCDGSGSCTGGGAKDCSHLETACKSGVCKQSAGGCTTDAKPDGTECGDDHSCDSGTVTLQDTCQGGSCRDQGTNTCDPYATCADATTCATSCRDASECTGDLVCRDGGCESNSPPTADAGADQTVTADTEVTLDATGSSDPDGDSLTYTWQQTAGPDVSIDTSTATPTFHAPTDDLPVTLEFELVVDDGFTDSSPDTVAITVEPPPNEAPTAAAGDDRVVSETDEVTLDGSDSADPDGDSLDYKWRQTRGPSVTLDDTTPVQPTFTAPEVDASTDLAFELEVDDGEATDTDTVAVTVEPEPTADTGTGDAGDADAGRTDSGPRRTDTGAAEDAGVTIGPSNTDSGCSCTTTRPTPPAGGTLLTALIGLIGLGFRRRRRRQR
ncbi:MAG: PKD domain-containing protein, partial [Bradymonadaceae bacterium]